MQEFFGYCLIPSTKEQKMLEAIPEDVLAQYRTAVKEENAYSHQK